MTDHTGQVAAHWSYAVILAVVLVACGWLEFVVGTRVVRRWLRLALTILPVLVVFVAWDAYAIAAGHWTFDRSLILGVMVPGHVPLDEVLFFIVIPYASILTFEAVRSVRGWPAGDES